MVYRGSVANLGLYRQYVPTAPVGPPPELLTQTDAAKTATTGTEIDDKFAAQIIGKDIPIFVGGQALIGCRICEGPFITTDTGEGFVDMIVTAALACTPTATRELRSIRLNGTESFTSSDGGATWTPIAAGPFDDVEIEVRTGTETQLPFDSSITRYGARAVPYRSHILVELRNIPLSVFNNVIPFVSVEVWEADDIDRRDALAKLAAFARYDATEYEFNVSGTDTFWIVSQQSTFIEYLQVLQRSIGRNWNILPADKLYVYENSATVTPIVLTRDDVVADSIRFEQVDPLSIPAIRTLGFIDTGRDNDINQVKAVRARFPVPLTASSNTEDLEIPIGMTATAAKTAVNKSLLIDDIGRDRVSFKALPKWRGLQAGDIIDINAFDPEVQWDAARILTGARNGAEWSLDFTAERIRISLLSTGPSITSDATITVDEEDGVSVVTVTADQAGTFSIVGGDDSALFTINSSTGVLEFLTEPDFEDPQDADADNVYEVIVQVLAGSGLSGTQIVTVTVADVIESGVSGSPMGLLLALTHP